MRQCTICGSFGHREGPRCPGYELQKRQDPFGLDAPVKVHPEPVSPELRDANENTLFL